MVKLQVARVICYIAQRSLVSFRWGSMRKTVNRDYAERDCTETAISQSDCDETTTRYLTLSR